jgi:hypothetical protein
VRARDLEHYHDPEPNVHRCLTPVLCLTSFFTFTAAQSVHAQIQASERASISQTVDSTTITIEYSRPAARGRDLFGALVPWNVNWTGANWATTVDVNRPIRLNGVDVPVGKYSIWIEPHEDAPWTVSLDANPKIWHSQKPDSTADQIHLAATPEVGPHAELLTWSFPAVTGDAAALHMQWGTTALPLHIVVQPTRPVALDPEDRRAYVGTFDVSLTHPRWPANGQLEVFEENGLLRARLPFPLHPGDELAFDLVPAGSDRFSPGLFRDGRLFNVEMGVTLEFDGEEDGRMKIVRLRAVNGRLLGEGTRAPTGN